MGALSGFCKTHKTMCPNCKKILINVFSGNDLLLNMSFCPYCGLQSKHMVHLKSKSKWNPDGGQLQINKILCTIPDFKPEEFVDLSTKCVGISHSDRIIFNAEDKQDFVKTWIQIGGFKTNGKIKKSTL